MKKGQPKPISLDEAKKLWKVKRYCFCCEKKLELVWEKRVSRYNSPLSDPTNNSIYFTSHGNYGSTVFDDYTGKSRLEIYICDDCLKKKAKFGFVVCTEDARKFVKFDKYLKV